MASEKRFKSVLAGIVVGFVVLGLFELIVSLNHFKPALFVDGLHNLLAEGALLGINLVEHGRKDRGLDESRLPLWTAVGVLVTGLPAGTVGWFVHGSESHTVAAILLAALSLALCIGGLRIVHSCGLEDDHNAESVLNHLLADMAIAGTAILVYGLELAGVGAWIDPVATIGAVTISAFISLHYIARHRAGHAHMTAHMQPGSH